VSEPTSIRVDRAYYGGSIFLAHDPDRPGRDFDADPVVVPWYDGFLLRWYAYEGGEVTLNFDRDELERLITVAQELLAWRGEPR
jgi:hypothetical protein